MTAFNVPGTAAFHRVSTADNNAVVLKTSPGTLWDLVGMNVNTTTPRFIKFYDKATAPDHTVDVPAYVVPLPTVGSANGGINQRLWSNGLRFLVGIAYTIVGGIADNDNTAIGAGDVILSGSFS